jgi:hypothetical protein
MFCASGLVFSGSEGVGSLFHVLCSRTHFQRYRGCRFPFSCFVLSDSSSAIPWASGPVFMFCVPGIVFGDTVGLRSHFPILRARTRSRRYRSNPIFLFSAPGHIFGDIKGVGSRFYVLRSQTCFRWYRGRRVPFSCFTLPYSFSAVLRASVRVFMFCAPEFVFGDTVGVGSRFHVLRARTHFRRYRWRGVPFSCFALRNTFSVVPRASRPVFMFFYPGPVFGGTEGLGSRFHVFRSRTSFWRYLGIGSRFHVLRARTRCRRYRRRQIQFSSFPLSDMFSVVPRASGPVFMFCAPRPVFGGTEGVGSLFHVLRSRTHFRRYRGRRAVRSYFHVLRSRTRFRRYRVRPVPFSCFTLPNMFSAVPRESGPVFMYFFLELVFGGTVGIGSRFHVLRAQTRFRRYRGRRVPFSCLALADSFLAVLKA